MGEENLAEVLAEFARTLLTEFPIQGILDHLVLRIVDVLPVTSAGVTLISRGKAPHYIAASDDNALRYEKLQTEIGEGPCLLAYSSGEGVAVDDLESDSRFPRFGPPAVAAGLGAVFAFPLRHDAGQLGALDLYRETPGPLRPEEMQAAQTLADVAAAYLLNAEARDEARATADRFHHSALHDPLTGLPNRILLEERLEHAAQRSRRSQTSTAVLFVDLDKFKSVNDTHGHKVGDELLLAVAQRLAGLVRSGDTLARVSGDEFVFLCEDLQSSDDVEILARRIDEAFSNPFFLPSVCLAVSASVGMAVVGPGETVSDLLVAQADTAMYQVKRKGGDGHQTIDLREALLCDDSSSLERDLRLALVEQTLELAYQPIVRSQDGLVTGVEALLRWTHPERGQVSPMTVVGVAEQSGLINAIGAWVLERSCADRTRWLHDHPSSPLDLSVNVSGRQLATPEFVAVVSGVLERSGMDPQALILEMTENIFIDDSGRALAALGELRDLGIRLALDDFGTGYSSLSYLRRLPMNIVKIDRTFIADIGYAPKGRDLVAAVANVANVLGLEVTAEGVETRRQRDEIYAIGCESAQGYYFARPMSASAIGAQLGAVPSTPLHLPSS